MKLRDVLFKDLNGCTNHGCVVTGPKAGMGTNGTCSCVSSMNRGQLTILQSRIKAVDANYRVAKTEAMLWLKMNTTPGVWEAFEEMNER